MDEFNYFRIGAWVDKGVWREFESVLDQAFEAVSTSKRIAVVAAAVTITTFVSLPGTAQSTSFFQSLAPIPETKRNSTAGAIDAELDRLEARLESVIESVSAEGCSLIDTKLILLADATIKRRTAAKNDHGED